MPDGMANLLYAIESFFSLSWRFFTEVEVPCLGVSFATFWIAVLFMSFAIRVLSVMLGSHVFLSSVPVLPSAKGKPGSIRNDPDYFMS